MGEVLLTKYQENSIYKMVESHKTDHGLLFWWLMGTGKTIAGITFMLNFPDRKINIICPEDITFIWTNELKKIPAVKMSNITFYSYEKANEIFSKSTFKDELIVADEAHHLISAIKSIREIKYVVDLFNTAYKIVLLTGTPIYTELSDLVYLVNISAGKEIMPYNHSEFKHKFYKVNKIKSILVGHLVNFTIALQKATSYGGAPVLGLLAASGATHGITSILKNAVKKEFADVGNTLTTQEIKDKNMMKNAMAIWAAYNVITLFAMISKSLLNYKMDDYSYLNTKLLADTINPYVTYYKNKDKVSTMYFPSSKRIITTVPYNNHQLDVWIKLTQDSLNVKTISELDIKSEDDAKFYTKTLNPEEYINKGVLIGNLSNNKGDFSPKFYEILKVSAGKRAVFYSSSLNSGIHLFQKFLEKNNIEYLYLNIGITTEEKNKILDIFRDTTIFLLLHPSYTEGVTVLGAEQLHLIEPVPLLSKKEQIIARVVRYKSHEHLPLNKRHVDIYQWCCEMKTVMSKINKIKNKIKNWITINPEVFITEKYNTFDQDMTPDSVVLKKELINITNDLKLTEELEKRNKDEEMSCCIKYPGTYQDEECMKKLGKHCN